MTQILGIVSLISSRESPDSHRMAFTALSGSLDPASGVIAATDTVTCTVATGTATQVVWWAFSGDKSLYLSADTSAPYVLTVSYADAQSWYESLTGTADAAVPALTFVAEVIGPNDQIFVSGDYTVTDGA